MHKNMKKIVFNVLHEIFPVTKHPTKLSPMNDRNKLIKTKMMYEKEGSL